METFRVTKASPTQTRAIERMRRQQNQRRVLCGGGGGARDSSMGGKIETKPA